MSDARTSRPLIIKRKKVIAKHELLESRYCFQRAAIRLFSTSALATPVQRRSISAINRRQLLSFIPRQSPHYAFQHRWNSDEAGRRELFEAENDKDNKKNAENKSEDAATQEGKRGVTEETEPGLKSMPTQTVAEIEPETISQNLEESANPDPDAVEEGPRTESKPTSNKAQETAPTPPSGPARFRYVEQPAAPKETVFISNLYFDITADDLRKKMEDFGVVENVTIVHDARGISRG